MQWADQDSLAVEGNLRESLNMLIVARVCRDALYFGDKYFYG